jgi:xanthine dehydrogenase iron-sulfur cluster and FAD-binding subunit A
MNTTNSMSATNSHILNHRFAYLRPTSLKEAFAMLKEHADARILAGGTNVLVDMKMQAKPADALPSKVMDITRIPGLAGIAEDGSGVRIGAATPIRALATSNHLWTSYTALAEAAAAFGSTQIAMRGTIGGNICNGSPASDTVPALLVLGAEAILASASGERVVPLGDLLSGPGKVRLRDGEILTAVRLPKSAGQAGSAFLKIGRVRADLAKVNVAVRLTRDEAGRCASARIELGSVGPTVLRARKSELLLSKEMITDAKRLAAAEAAAGEIQPIDDVRSTAEYRRRVAVALVHDSIALAWARCTGQIAPAPSGKQAVPVLRDLPSLSVDADESVVVSLTVNGEAMEIDVAPNELLLNVLRERLELTGSKYGCGVGECGACTVWLDGQPALACLVLAVAADGANVRTIEGLAAPDGTLDPLQQAFIDEDAFQCGYCTPGMLMMTKKLLEEIPQPTEDEIRGYLRGNHCRCTGYASITRAVLRAVGRVADAPRVEGRAGGLRQQGARENAPAERSPGGATGGRP